MGVFRLVHGSQESVAKEYLRVGQPVAGLSPELEIALSPDAESRLAAGTDALLPSDAAWVHIVPPRYPITINWLLTGECSLNCMYCYAQDMMSLGEPDSVQRVRELAAAILSYEPLAVVLTGGDPLCSPWLESAIEVLAQKTGLIVDTNGVALSEHHVALFKRHHVSVRISLDSEMPEIANRLRPMKGGESSAPLALDAICRCLAAGLPVTVQTVATVLNAPDLPFMGDKLYRLGVRHWRILQVAPSAGSATGYRVASGADKSGRSARFDHTWDSLCNRRLRPRMRSWNRQMALTLVDRSAPNAVILVGSDGAFYTESDLLVGKMLIDSDSPMAPSLSAIHLGVDMLSHIKRYLGTRRMEGQ